MKMLVELLCGIFNSDACEATPITANQNFLERNKPFTTVTLSPFRVSERSPTEIVSYYTELVK
jgi:hypothetical protein